jgi:hypothetical protein
LKLARATAPAKLRCAPDGVLLAGVLDGAAHHREGEGAQVGAQRGVVLPVAPRHPQHVLVLGRLLVDGDLQSIPEAGWSVAGPAGP